MSYEGELKKGAELGIKIVQDYLSGVSIQDKNLIRVAQLAVTQYHGFKATQGIYTNRIHYSKSYHRQKGFKRGCCCSPNTRMIVFFHYFELCSVVLS